MSGVAQLIGTLLALFGGIFVLVYGVTWCFYRARERNFPSLLPYVVIPDWQRALVYSGGNFSHVAGPGRVWRLGRGVFPVSIDEQTITIEAAQHICADRRPVHLGAAVMYRVSDPRRAFETTNDPRGAFLAECVAALDDVIAARPLARLLDERRYLDTLLYATLAPIAEQRGMYLEKVLILNVFVAPDVLASLGLKDAEEEGAPDPFRPH